LSLSLCRRGSDPLVGKFAGLQDVVIPAQENRWKLWMKVEFGGFAA